MPGQLVKGQHPALIDLEIFTKANDLINSSPNSGIPKKQKHEELPLKIFAKEKETNSPITGFRQKGIWYYKAKGAKFCVNAAVLNQAFVSFLDQFEYNRKYKSQLKVAIEKKLKQKLASVLEENIQLKKRITELKNQIDLLEEKFVLNKISQELYIKFHKKFKQEQMDLEEQLSKSLFDSSNLEKAVEKGLKIAQNLRQDWISKDYNGKQKLQYLVFPDGIRCTKEKGLVQTTRINSLFQFIEPQTRLLERNKKSNSEKNCLKSDLVTPPSLSSNFLLANLRIIIEY